MRLKYLARHIDERHVTEDTELLSVSKSRGVVPRSEVSDNPGRAEDISHYKTCKPGDLVINRMAAYQGALGIAKQFGAISPDYMVLRFRESLDSRYVGYLFKSSFMANEMTSRVKGIGSIDSGSVRTPRLSWSDLGNVDIPVPPLEEQKAIADFLDRELGKIDFLVEKQKSLIELLEYRFLTEVETQVVGGATHSDSWLSNLPEGWKQVPLKIVADVAAGGTPNSEKEEYWLGPDDQEGISWLGIGDFVEDGAVFKTERRLSLKGLHSKRLPIGEPGTILYAMYASVGSVSKLGVEGSWSQAILGVTPKNGINGDYLYWALRAVKKQLPFYYRSNTQNNVNANQVKSLKMPFPPLDQQKKIAEKLGASTERTQIAIHKCSELVQKLQQKKNALISASVTGEIAVRGN